MTNHVKQLPDDLTTLLKQLVRNGQLLMAGLTLKTYFIRCWKVDVQLSGYYVRRYFEKYFPYELEKHLSNNSKQLR